MRRSPQPAGRHRRIPDADALCRWYLLLRRASTVLPGPQERRTPITSAGIDVDRERALAKELFNHVWTLLETEQRTKAQDDEMIHAAHASRFHWGRCGGPVQLCRGEWQVSRVYSVLGRGEPAVYHAQRCLDICEENSISGFDHAIAHEALARAHAIAGDLQRASDHAQRAHDLGDTLEDEEDRRIFDRDMATLPSGLGLGG